MCTSNWWILINKNYDIVILGAGAAGLMCAITAAKRNKSEIGRAHV
jgi:flavin-dependent dehydrogenase